MANKKETNKKSKEESKSNYNAEQQRNINDSIRAIKEYYGEDVSPKVVNSILGNIAVETDNFTDLRENAWTWKNIQDYKDNGNYSSINSNIKKWGGSEEEYNKLSQGERLSVMYYGDTDHASTAGGSGSLHLTSAGYGGNDKTHLEYEEAANELGLDFNTINDDFYNSTLATIKVFDKRGVDFTEYESPLDLRKNVINPKEKLKADDHRIATLNKFNEDPFDLTGKVPGHQSINPDLIANNPNLDDGTKEELLKINESQGLEESTIADLNQSSGSLLNNYGGGYSGALDLNSFLVNNEMEAKKQKAQEQQAGPTNQGQQALGYAGSIAAFDPEFNLLSLDDEANKGFKKGGKLNAEPAANALTEYNEGGSHEQNPHGGIPVGQNSKGGLNLVEQGETRFGDYVYSNEYELTEDDAERFNINPSYVGKSYSDISKEINEEMKTRPYDRLVKKTAEGNLNKLMMAQETVRQQEAANTADTEFNEGGGLKIDPSGIGTLLGSGAAFTQLGKQAFNGSNLDTSGATRQNKTNVAGAALGSAAKGAAAGAAIGSVVPVIGTAIGGIVGGIGGAVSGVFGGVKDNKDAIEANKNAAMVENNQFRSEDAIAKKGGLLDTYLEHGGPHDPPKRTSSGEKILEAIGNRFDQIPEPDWGKTGEWWKDVFTSDRRAARLAKRAEAEKKVEPAVSTEPGSVKYPVTGPAKGDARNQWIAEEGVMSLPYQPGTYVEENNQYPISKSRIPQPAFFPGEEEQKEVAKTKLDADRAAYNQEQLDMYGRDAQAQLDEYNQAQEQKQLGLLEAEFAKQQDVSDAIRALEGIQNTNDVGVHNAMSSNRQTKTAEEQAKFLKENPEADANVDPQSSIAQAGFSELLRYAPTIGNALQLMTLPKAEVESYDRLDNRYIPQYADEMAMQNIVSQGAANTRSAIQQMSNGSASAARASLLGSQVNEQRALSDAYMQMDGINRQQDEKAQQFNLGVDQYNQQVDTQESIANAQNRAARRNMQHTLKQNIMNDLGNIGKEQFQARIMQNVSGGYKTDGTKAGGADDISLFDQVGDMYNKVSGIFTSKKKKGGELDLARKIFDY